jgi:hypothetical protein
VRTAFGFYIGSGVAFLSTGVNHAPTSARNSVLQYWNGSAWATADGITLDNSNNPNPGVIIASSPERVYWWAKRDETSGPWLFGSVLRRNATFTSTPTAWTAVYDHEGGGAARFAIIYP